MNRLSTLTALTAVAALAGLLIFSVPERDAAPEDWTVTEQARLENALLHAESGSAQAFKLQTKLDRLDAWRESQPQPGFPDEFNRVLYEMKIPSDRTTPEYEPGYRYRELAKVRRVRSLEKDLVWHSRGPGNVAGRARSIVVDPVDPTGQTWFIASVGGGVWYTDDNGSTWAGLTDDMPTLAIQSLVMAPSNTDVLYAGTGESFYNVDTMNGNGMLKTEDRGLTWAPIASTLDDPRFNNVSRIVVDPADEDVLVVTTTTGTYKASLYPNSHIMRSTDGGTSWTEVYTTTGTSSFSGPRILQIVADPTDFNIQYASVYAAGILKSTDAGVTWVPAISGITDFTGRFELAISPVNTDYIFASAEGASHSELWVSWDGGANWNETVESGGEPNWLGAQGWYDNTIVCHPIDPTIVYVGGPELWKIDIASVGSTSRSTTRMASYSFPHPDHHGLAIVEDGGGWWILGTNDGGLTRTSTEETGFTMPTDGMTTTQFYGVDKKPGASAYFGGMQDNGTWYSGSDPVSTTPWTFAIGGDGYETSWHFDDPQKMIGGYQYNGLQRSLNGGVSWTSATSGMSDTGSGSAPFITKIGKSTARPDDLFAVGASGVWYSTDFGGSWNLANIASGTWGGVSSFQDVRVSPADADVVWAGSRMDASGDIIYSTDGGLNFNAATDYTDVTMGRISGMATDPHDANTAYVLFSYAERPKILKTTDLGVTWTDISGFGTGSVSTNGFPDVAIYDLIVFPNDADKIWVGSEIGLIESLDGGASWALADNGLPAVGIWQLKVVEDEVVLATHGRGIWSTTDAALMDGSTYNPLFESAVQVPAGDLQLDFNLRSAYDYTEVWIDGAVATTFPANTPLQSETLVLPVVASGSYSIFARGYQGTDTFDSITRDVDVIVLAEPMYEYSNNLNNDIDADDFQRSGFIWSNPAGFSNGALHTGHPYLNGATDTAMLLTPIRVSQLSTLSFDEVAIIEPGEPGSVFGDSDFWDYVIVEGSLDGVVWQPLLDGYDARDDAAWQSAYSSGSDGTSAMFRNRSLNLNETFGQGDTILLRFRLFADGYVVGWGWALDNIVITAQGVSGAGDVPGAVTLGRNYPNPFNPRTNISFNLPKDGRVKLQVFDLRGRLVKTLVDGVRPTGEHNVVWEGRDNRGSAAASGIYFYRLEANGTTLQEKMTLLK